LTEFTARGLHCDAYTLGDGRVFVLGHDDHAATVAILMLNFTADVDLLLDGHDSEWTADRLLAAPSVWAYRLSVLATNNGTWDCANRRRPTRTESANS
jgi:thioredoxin reductase